MGIPPTRALRLAEEKSGVANRKDPLEFDTFIARWNVLMEKNEPAWQSGWALTELRDKKLLSFLCPPERHDDNWRARDVFGRLLDEMKAYRDESCRPLIKENYRDTKEFLQKEVTRVQKVKERSHLPDLRALLESVEKKLSKSVLLLDDLKDRRRTWSRGVSQHLWHDVPRSGIVEGKPGLDTRLQVEAGKIFADYLLAENVSIETIARLVVLAYWVGELAELDGRCFRTTYTHRKLTVRNVRDILRKKKIVESYRSRSR